MVIAIVGILVALLLPAVQAARDAGRRTQCMNNVKNIALAGHSHLDALKQFPTGGWGFTWVGDPDRGFGDQQPGGFLYNILPFIEEEALHDMGSGLGDGSPTNEKGKLLLQMIQTPIPVYTCPTRRPCKAYGTRQDRLWMYNTAKPGASRSGESNGYGWFKSCYAASGGSDGGGWGTGPATHAQGDAMPPGNSSINNGISGQRSVVTAKHVVDGLSKTYMAGEKYINPIDYENEYGRDFGDDEPALGGDDLDLYRVGNCFDLPAQDEPNIWRSRSWGGPHPGVFNMAFCDGSVHAISYDIEPELHAMQANREDGDTFVPCGGPTKPSRGDP